jgi:hypothetical protein
MNSLLEAKLLWALFIGFTVGLFLVLGSASILKRTLKLLEEDKKPQSWSFSQAIGLSSLWFGKIVAASAILYVAQRLGYSTQALGVALPLGIMLGAWILHLRVK